MANSSQRASVRRPRLSDEQTARRVLDAALAQLAEEGIAVALDGLRFEDVIRAAGVSRSSAYRRWPTREALVEDVLVELAGGSYQPALGAVVAEGTDEVLRRVGMEPADPAGRAGAADRRDVLVELVRQAFQVDLVATAGSPEFRSYLALRAAVAGVTSVELRERIAAALAHSERRTVARGAAVLEEAARLFGQRLVAPLEGREGFAVVAQVLSAASVGFVVAAQSAPDLLTTTTRMAAYGSSRAAAWSVPVFALTGIVLGHLEPDSAAAPVPAAELRERLSRLVDVGAAAAAAAQ